MQRSQPACGDLSLVRPAEVRLHSRTSNMLARRLLLVLLAKLGLLNFLVLWLVHHESWPWANALTVAVLTFFALPAVFVTTLYFFAWRFGAAEQPITTEDLFGNGAREYLALVSLINGFLPFERLCMGADKLHHPADERLPLLLVHGFRANRGCWWWLRSRLEAAGLVVATINLEPILTDIEHLADNLARRVEEVCAATGCERINLLGHSMGGLVIRAYLRRYGPSRVCQALTLGTPHHGSLLAWLAPGPNSRQMRPGDPWLMKLNADLALCSVPLTVVYSDRDNYVLPHSRQALSGASNHQVHGTGHLALLFSEETARRVLDWSRSAK